MLPQNPREVEAIREVFTRLIPLGTTIDPAGRHGE
jgi:hypothetical protein